MHICDSYLSGCVMWYVWRRKGGGGGVVMAMCEFWCYLPFFCEREFAFGRCALYMIGCNICIMILKYVGCKCV